jgi:hypothetical protein
VPDVDASTRAAEGTDLTELDTTYHGSTAGRWMGAASGGERGEGKKAERRRGEARRPAGGMGKSGGAYRIEREPVRLGFGIFFPKYLGQVDGPRAFLFAKIPRPAQYSAAYRFCLLLLAYLYILGNMPVHCNGIRKYQHD